MKRAVARRGIIKTRRGRKVRAGVELVATIADWGASLADWARNDGNLRDRIAAWYEVVSGQVVVDDQDE